MNKLTPILKVLFKILQKILSFSVVIAMLSFEISPPKYHWVYCITYLGQGIIAGYIMTNVDIIFNDLYKNIFNKKLEK